MSPPAKAARPPRSGKKSARPALTPAKTLPIARVWVDVALSHVDRTFDYLVPETLDTGVAPGVRVRVRFAGRLVDGIVAERVESSDHAGKLAFLERLMSAEPVLTPEIAHVARQVAGRYAGTMNDVLRLAVPQRHVGAESAAPSAQASTEQAAESTPVPNSNIDSTGWGDYSAGKAFLQAVAAGRPARAVWSALPGEDWCSRIAEAVTEAVAAGRGALVIVPDARDLRRLEEKVAPLIPPAQYAVLAAALGPAERYRRWLSVLRATATCVLGTRAAAFAPVANLGLVVIWDDNDDSHAELRAPYCHAREVLLLRAHNLGAAALIGGHIRTAEAQLLLETGWAQPLMAGRPVVRERAPRITALGEDAQLAGDAAPHARLPSVAWQAAREALASDAPVLVQVPRRGYVPGLSCQNCRAPARCSSCAGPLRLAEGGSIPACRWCGRPHAGWRCGACGGARLRASVIGAGRTAEELGRAFPQVPVVTSRGGAALEQVAAARALVVATPGVEPVAEGGYGAALLLDGWALLNRPDLRANEEALRRWMNAAALVRPAGEGGRVVVAADSALSVVQALLRWDPAWRGERELTERVEVGFPPAVRMAKLVGVSSALAELVAAAQLPASVELLGPVPVEEHDVEVEREQLLIRVPRQDGLALARALRGAVVARAVRKAADQVRIQLDPHELT